MNVKIKHESRGRMRIHMTNYKHISTRQADLFLYYISNVSGVYQAKVYEYTADAVICYDGDRLAVINAILDFRYDQAESSLMVPEQTGRELNNHYREQLIIRVISRIVSKWMLPYPVNVLWTTFRALKYALKGLRVLLKGKLDVDVLDAIAISVSMIRNDIATAGSVMFLLGVGELLEEWTHKKSVDDLARSMSLNIHKVWVRKDGCDIITPVSQVNQGECVCVYAGAMIPFDGVIVDGIAMINESSLTGESMPIKKEKGTLVYAGTVVEEGEIVFVVEQILGSSRYEKIVTMIEESEKLKSSLEGKAQSLADKLVPYSLAGTVLTYLLTKNTLKALSILMVDFSCALKLAMPISVLSAMRECSTYSITVKGGKYLEAIAKADTIVFDKTGTLTKAEPRVAKVIPFGGNSEMEMLRIAACLEEHFPHSMAKAVVNEAEQQGLTHNEMHSKVDYIVAHGIASSVEGEKVIIGSHHFVFEDEGCTIPANECEKYERISTEYSHLYLAISGQLSAVICIEDPLREEAATVISTLKRNGIKKIVMMTGDSERTARAVAEKVGIDEYYSEVLPEDKAKFIDAEKQAGKTVVMIGDGINDSPALSAADVGIAISEGAEIAREIADITIEADSLNDLVTLKLISDGLVKRSHYNYRFIIGFNLALIVAGVSGTLTPSTSALFHNASTLGISMKNMTPIL